MQTSVLEVTRMGGMPNLQSATPRNADTFPLSLSPASWGDLDGHANKGRAEFQTLTHKALALLVSLLHFL